MAKSSSKFSILLRSVMRLSTPINRNGWKYAVLFLYTRVHLRARGVIGSKQPLIKQHLVTLLNHIIYQQEHT
jgi:hypothetical protein